MIVTLKQMSNKIIEKIKCIRKIFSDKETEVVVQESFEKEFQELFEKRISKIVKRINDIAELISIKELTVTRLNSLEYELWKTIENLNLCLHLIESNKTIFPKSEMEKIEEIQRIIVYIRTLIKEKKERKEKLEKYDFKLLDVLDLVESCHNIIEK